MDKTESTTKSKALYGPYGSSAIPYIAQMQAAGANAFWFHGFDARAFEACARYGIMACVEFKTFRADFQSRPELIPTGVDGRPIRYGRLVQGVCLSQQDFLDETEAHLRDGLAEFQPTGIWLDYLTYGGWFEEPDPDLQENCFCPACVAEFCQATGLDAETPTQILAQHQAAWTRHKCERVAGYAFHYASLIREALPNAMVGAYMCPWTPTEYDGALSRIFAQDYELMAPAIDIFTPLIYVQKSGRTAAWGREWLEASPAFVPQDRRVQPILDVLEYPDSLLQMAQSSVPSWGVQIFGGAEVFADQEKTRIFQTVVEEMRG